MDVERVRRLAAELGVAPAECVALFVLVAGAALTLGLLWHAARPTGDEVAFTPAVEPQDILVHVAGRVAAPGVYRLTSEARVADALAAAGGALPDAVLDGLNLARALADGEQILVPGAQPEGDSGPAAVAAQASAWRADGRLDINRAAAEDFDQLPGIGPVLASRIVSHRDTNGPFTAVGDLRQVPGIGERKFQSIAELVTV